jgi:hypothetical protein
MRWKHAQPRTQFAPGTWALGGQRTAEGLRARTCCWGYIGTCRGSRAFHVMLASDCVSHMRNDSASGRCSEHSRGPSMYCTAPFPRRRGTEIFPLARDLQLTPNDGEVLHYISSRGSAYLNIRRLGIG